MSQAGAPLPWAALRLWKAAPLRWVCVCSCGDGQGSGGRNWNLRPQPRPVRQGLLRSSLPSTPSLPVSPLPGPTTSWHLTSPPMNWPKDSLGAYWAGGQIGQLPGSLFPHLCLLHPARGNVGEILRNSPSPRTHATSLS